ncbi:MAG: hypothetical protein M1827_006936 [Pycnora praestabilis]|nr:MAG: hypothetical protein M1827_006936 [Pycnora praestabilis]
MITQNSAIENVADVTIRLFTLYDSTLAASSYVKLPKTWTSGTCTVALHTGLGPGDLESWAGVAEVAQELNSVCIMRTGAGGIQHAGQNGGIVVVLFDASSLWAVSQRMRTTNPINSQTAEEQQALVDELAELRNSGSRNTQSTACLDDNGCLSPFKCKLLPISSPYIMYGSSLLSRVSFCMV